MEVRPMTTDTSAGPGASQAEILKTVLDEHRLKIIGLLTLEPRTPAGLADALGLGPREAIRHLSMLEHFGLVARDPDSDRCRLDTQALHAFKREFFTRGETVPAETREEAILNRFLDGERIKQIPAKLSHRMLLLDWLIEKFDHGVDYPERIVSEMLEQHHPDYASLRRAFIDYGYMTRTGGVYRRLPPANGEGAES
jgi:hypothetical protein